MLRLEYVQLLTEGLGMAAARVLVVDDESIVLDVVTRILLRGGYVVFPAAGADEALAIVRDNSPIDLVLCDARMPGMGGPELVREIARISPRTSRIVMSGAPVDQEQLPRDTTILPKPFSPQNLGAAVEAALAKTAKARAALVRACGKNIELRQQTRRLRSELRDAIRQKDPRNQ
jgi:CheY-like chemotaxis protein